MRMMGVCRMRDLEQQRIHDAPFALISIRDPDMSPVVPHPDNVITDRLDLVFNDVQSAGFGLGLLAPNRTHALQIVEFCAKHESVIVQCTQGIGRSAAVLMAYMESRGDDISEFIEAGTHNIRLRRLVRKELGLPDEVDPLVSIVARVKYDASYLEALLLSLRRQRHTNWELIAVTDGYRPDIRARLRTHEGFGNQVRLILTEESRGKWGHPWRQLGIEVALGDWIGLTNDDNYYVPGYLEQMLYAAKKHRADIVLCDHLHSYKGWDVMKVDVATNNTGDIGAWLAKAELVRSAGWSGDDVDYETTFLWRMLTGQQLTSPYQRAPIAAKVAYVRRPLFVHN